MKPALAALALASLTLLQTPAQASDEVTDAIQAAYAPYRAVLFRTNTNSQAESEQAMAAARKAWQDILQRFGSKAPAPYDRDPQFSASLAKVDSVYAKAQQLVQGGKLTQAHEALEEARDVLGELRARNGVITFSDHMNEYHARMEEVLAKGAGLLDQPNGTALLLERTAVLGYLAAKLRTDAPAALAGNAEFQDMHKALTASVENLRAALLKQDAAAARKSVDSLKGPYSKMFLKFG